MLDVITIGSASKDVFLISEDFKLVKSNKFKTGVGECFAYGSKVPLQEIYFDTGGGATNAAFTFANLKLKTGVVSRIGKDIYGQEIIAVLKKKKVDTTNIFVDKDNKTAYSTILLIAGGDRTILVYRGTAANFSDQDIKWQNIKTKWFYVTSLAGNINMLKKIFRFAKENKINIAWNPGGGELKLGLQKLKPLISQAKLFNLNLQEAQKLTDLNNVNKIFEKLSFDNDYNIITDGSNGAYLSVPEGLFRVKTTKVKVVNTTGAGDAFGSAFTAGLIKKDDWKYAVRLAILNSQGVITKMGAKHGLLTRLPSQKELDKIKIEKI